MVSYSTLSLARAWDNSLHVILNAVFMAREATIKGEMGRVIALVGSSQSIFRVVKDSVPSTTTSLAAPAIAVRAAFFHTLTGAI